MVKKGTSDVVSKAMVSDTFGKRTREIAYVVYSVTEKAPENSGYDIYYRGVVHDITNGERLYSTESAYQSAVTARVMARFEWQKVARK